ncbi:MAG: apolipoprotein N-acyltransferase [Planctomycetes bacterium]|nr:apolipoprotein N-acyltransferase [Planctomycetota bacterium]
MKLLPACLLAVACGVLAAWPFLDGAAFFVWFAFAPLFWVLAQAPTRKRLWALVLLFLATWIGLGQGFIAYRTLPGYFPACLWTMLFYLPPLLWVRALAKRGIYSAVFVTAALLTLTELARTRMPIFGFPWLLLGHAVGEYRNLRQGADLLGVPGLSFLAFAVNAVLAFVVLPALRRDERTFGTRGRRWACSAAVVGMLAALWIYGAVRARTIESHLVPGPLVAWVQGSVYEKVEVTDEQRMKWLEDHVELHAKAALGDEHARTPDLICWAETMVPGLYNKPGDEFHKAFVACVRAHGIPTLFGSTRCHPDDFELPVADQRWYNCAFLADRQGEIIADYAKRKLVPFGEYIPLKETFPFLKHITSVTKDTYTPGGEPSPVADCAGVRFAFNVCVEDTYPELAREGALAGAEVFLNVTNDAWFFPSSGQHAHLLGARLRAIETRRPLLRATNSGVSAWVDPLGEIHRVVEPDTVGVGFAEVRLVSGAGSDGPRTMAMRLGEGPAALLLALLAFACFMMDRKIKQ